MIGLHRTLSAAAILLACLPAARAQLVPPANDDCTNAIVITDGSVTGTTIGSTISTNGCGLSGLTPDVWYQYTATRTGLLALDTCGSSYDTSLTLYATCGGPQVTCNDDAPLGAPCGYNSFSSYLNYPIRSGETIRIRVSGFVGAQGAFVLTARNDTGQPFCLGDNLSATVCPCGNSVPVGTRSGCRNTTGVGARLEAIGFATISNDSARLSVSGLTPGAPILFFQGDVKQSSGYGQSFGDGVRCVSGTIVRLGVLFAPNGTATYPSAGNLPLHTAGSVPTAGGITLYQGWYRNSGTFCLPTTFNLTNGLEVSWSP